MIAFYTIYTTPHHTTSPPLPLSKEPDIQPRQPPLLPPRLQNLNKRLTPIPIRRIPRSTHTRPPLIVIVSRRALLEELSPHRRALDNGLAPRLLRLACGLERPDPAPLALGHDVRKVRRLRG